MGRASMSIASAPIQGTGVEDLFQVRVCSGPALLGRRNSSKWRGAFDIVAASAKGDFERLQAALERGFVKHVDERALVGELETSSGLQEAAKYGHVSVCKLLLDFRANPNQQNVRCWTPLHHAASQGHLEVAKLLLDHGAVAGAHAALDGVSFPCCLMKWAWFFQNYFAGPTPRSMSREHDMVTLLQEHEEREWLRCLCCDTPRPKKWWLLDCCEVFDN